MSLLHPVVSLEAPDAHRRCVYLLLAISAYHRDKPFHVA